jgi:hypothetical protein
VFREIVWLDFLNMRVIGLPSSSRESVAGGQAGSSSNPH